MRTALTVALAFAAGVVVTLVESTGPHFIASSFQLEPPAATTSAATAAPVSVADISTDAPLIDPWPESAPTPEQVIYAQPRMVQDALAKLSPRLAGTPNLYLLAFAGDGSEDVFRNEAEYATQLFSRRFGPATHTLLLQNNPATLQTDPLASWSNLEAALHGLDAIMQPEDILVLYMTTHGSQDHTLLVDMAPLPLDQIGAQDLANILSMHDFRWKVLVINACYSGGFVPPLRGPGTLVMTAARSDRSSFGCGSESEITYFGHAWLENALNRTDNLVDAFTQASREIASWEKQDKLPRSEPQIDIGSGIEQQLSRWRDGQSPAPVVPFKPAAPASPETVPAR